MENQSRTQTILGECAHWAKYLAIISIAGIVINFLQMVFGVISDKGNIFGNLIGLVSAIIGLIMAISLFNFAKYINLNAQNHDSTYITQAFTNLKNYFIIIGVIFIILLSLFVLFLLIAAIVFVTKN